MTEISESSWVGKTLAGRYQLEDLICAGETSNVYRALDLELERPVAVKLLHARSAADSDLAARFRDEARIAAGLSHKNIVTVIAQGEVRDRPYIIFEYIDGMTLEQLLRRATRLPVDRALAIADDIGEGLEFAYRRGCVHRNVTPENVLVNAQGAAKLADFGLARPFADGDGAALSLASVPGDRVDTHSDVYALGAVLFEMLTGEVPLPGDTLSDAAAKPVGVSPQLDRTVARALAKTPAARFRTISELVAEIKACLDERSPALGFAAPAKRSKPKKTKAMQMPAPISIQHAVAQAHGPRRGAPAVRIPGGRAALVTVLALVALAVVYALTGFGLGGSHKATAVPPKKKPAHHRPKVHVAPPLPLPTLHEVAAYDPPPGDGVEQSFLLPYATDGKLDTAWSTEHYGTADFGTLKPGVGIVVDAGKPMPLPALAVESDTPGFSAVIKAGSDPAGPFTTVSAQRVTGRRTLFVLHVAHPRRYYVVWITRLPEGTSPRFHADINGVVAAHAPAAKAS
ncbi:MAG TPA: serine/threonine-protein kinase [Gaiellaceae bacterium]